MTTRTAYGPVVERMVALLADEFEPERIILFGSRARGDAQPDSDVDLLVIMPDGADETQATVAMHALLHKMPLPKDIVVSTPSAIARRGHIQGNVLYEGLREGVVLHERS